ncbi:MAG: hypothetical protein JNL74_07385 [Fibrobacteres bacterium]|nr:hypothetical protein [Fibrobacterota bacterium]
MISDSVNKTIKAVKANSKAAILLWLFAAAILLCYYKVTALRPYFDIISFYKLKLGFLFSMASTALFGALIPEVLKKVTGTRDGTESVKKTLYLTAVWAYKGLEVDALYRFQAYLFGSGNEMTVLLKKLAVDQLVYVPIWAVPSLVAMLLLPELNFNFKNWKSIISNGYYKTKVLPVMIPNWCIWAPSALMIYALPTSLQILMQNLVLCFWVLIFTFMIRPKE